MNRNRLAWGALGLVLSCLAALPALFAPVRAADRPNVVLLMGDDHGWEETGYNGHATLQTPVLDTMAASGLRLDRFYAAHPSCSPTRGSVLTGRHPVRYGTFAPNWSMRPEEITIAHVLRDAGYATGHFGKWHVGTVKADSPLNPGAMGFDEWLSHDNFFELHPTLSRNGAPPEPFEGESSAIVVDEAIRFMDRAEAEGKPFLAVVWFGSPHEPYSGLEEDLALYDELPAKYADRMVPLTSNETGLQIERPLGDVLRERYGRDHGNGPRHRHPARPPGGGGAAREHPALVQRRQRDAPQRPRGDPAARPEGHDVRGRHPRPRPHRMAGAHFRAARHRRPRGDQRHPAHRRGSRGTGGPGPPPRRNQSGGAARRRDDRAGRRPSSSGASQSAASRDAITTRTSIPPCRPGRPRSSS